MSASRNQQGWLTRERARAIVFVLLAAIVAVLCALVIEPLASSIAWAVAFAIIALPLHRWLLRRFNHPGTVAALVTLLVGVALVVPAAFIARQVGQEAIGIASTVQKSVKDDSWQQAIERNPAINAAFGWVGGVVNLKQQLGKLSSYIPEAVQKVVAGSLQIASGVVISLFLLFFFLRDREQMLKALRRLLPLSPDEDAVVFRKVADTIHAILYGTLAVALLQGTLGALMFWYLGLPAPFLWGAAMAALAIVPMLGTAIIWGPAAIYLFLEGDTSRALILAAWGMLVVGLVDNALKPFIVEGSLHVHLVPVFISIVGGLYAFGIVGLIAGPALLAIALGLIEVWRMRVVAQKV